MAEILGNMEWRRGDSYPFTITIKDSSSDPSVPIDITGYSFVFTVHNTKDPIDNNTRIFYVDGVVDPDQVVNTGKVSFTPLVTDTETLSGDGKYYYDIEMTDAASNVRTITEYGLKFTMKQDQTKP